MGMHPNMGVAHGFFMPPHLGAAGTMMPQMTAAHIVSLQHQHQHGGEGTCSECSSPPSSPRDSSDENDRGRWGFGAPILYHGALNCDLECSYLWHDMHEPEYVVLSHL